MGSPRPSATVVLARESDAGPELLFVKRRSGGSFSETYTFPGGVLDPDESRARNLCTGLSAAEADALLDVESGALDYYSAVVRELLEETGVMLGATEPVDDGLRRDLHGGDLAWADLLHQQNLVVPCETLEYFAHWITPAGLPKRWSTRFFLARMPAGQEVTPDGHEITDFCWLRAEQALAASRSGEKELPFPTRMTTHWLKDLESVAALAAWARERQQDGIRPIQPTIRDEKGKMRIFMPESRESDT
jgi:8-oxo-dGTP pyrophosphatase MutT (NUDIX family)